MNLDMGIQLVFAFQTKKMNKLYYDFFKCSQKQIFSYKNLYSCDWWWQCRVEYNAAKNVFWMWYMWSKPFLKFNNILKIKNSRQKSVAYYVLLWMQKQTLKNKYMDLTVQRLLRTSQDFLQYFINFYLCRKKKWAMFFRTCEYSRVNTNMFLESFHYQLKTLYFKWQETVQ